MIPDDSIEHVTSHSPCLLPLSIFGINLQLLWEGIACSHGSASARKDTLEPYAKQVVCDCVMILGIGKRPL